MIWNRLSWRILLRFCSDLILIPLVIIGAYALKFKLGFVSRHFFSIELGTLYTQAQLEAYLNGTLYITITWILTFYSLGLYRRFSGLMPIIDELFCLIKSVSLSTILLFVLVFIYPIIPESRYFIFYMGILGIFVLGSSRLLFSLIEEALLKRGIYTLPTLIIGNDSTCQDIAERMILYPSLGLKYCGFIANSHPPILHYHLQKRFHLLGNIEQLIPVIESHRIQRIYVGFSYAENSVLSDLLSYAKENKIEVCLLMNMVTRDSHFLSFENMEGIPLIAFSQFNPRQKGLYLKRFFDLFISLCLVLILLPINILIALFIKISSPKGEVLYTQERVGLDNKVFRMYKFRTMIPDAESNGPVMVDMNSEDRYIPFGKFLRKTSLDELPQLINIIKGEMSLIGPRPERPFFVEQFSKNIPYYNLRHRMKGGITGWAQVNGRSVLTGRPEHKARYDVYYIQNWSFLLDIKILIKTIKVVFTGEEAY